MMTKSVKRIGLHEEGNDLDFWLTVPPSERLASLEVLRQRYIRFKNMDIQKDFKEFLELLHQHEVAYLVVGGFAVAAHGYPRYTGDIDFWVRSDAENAGKLVEVIKEFGFGGLGIVPDDFIKPDHVVQLGYPPNRIDLLTAVTGLAFDDCWPARVTIEFENTPIHFLSLEHLRENKRLAVRKMDEIDLENLPS